MKVVPLATYEALLEKYNSLVTEMLAMKRDGWVPPEVYESPKRAPELPVAVEAAIQALGVDTATQRHLRTEAWGMLRAKEDEAAIVQKITEGEPVEL